MEETPAPEATQAPEEPKVEAKAEPAAAESKPPAASGGQWGLNYDEENLKFEEEWQAIADKVEGDQMDFLNTELSEGQKKKVALISEKVLDLNSTEQKYF